ncbi:TonB-dependent receptor [Lishizhenia sp.]|uniref:TonB-dependent receptor n=1 Tax=Lishizhenia sp. TaxID=2497594 RepID=UPI00299DF7A7|nr:TonB-dependent receptor [Lishizhenia sp.]MDX1446475.1 TonB-dependent receptor [Lishizhenia sp.]
MNKFLTVFILMASLYAVGQDSLRGIIIDNYTQTPIKEAIVNNGNQTVITQEDGRFALSCTGNMTIKVSQENYETWQAKDLSCNSELVVRMNATALNLSTFEVRGEKMVNQSDASTAQSVNVLSEKDLNRTTGLFLEEAVNLQTGVRMEKRTMSGGQRFTIRGYGNNTNFNGMGYKAYFNGIPLTDANGTTILDDIDFSTLGKVEIIKGPASSLYGTGIGGVVNMYTAKPKQFGTSIEENIIAGSYGLLRSTTSLKSNTETSTIALNYGVQNYDGYRVHSASQKRYLSFMGDFNVNKKQSFSTYFAYNNSYEELAGQLDSAKFFNRENVGEEKYLKNNGRVEIESYRAGLTHNYAFNKYISNQTTAFLSSSTLTQAYAVGLSDNISQNVGGRSVFTLFFPLGKKYELTGNIGAEIQQSKGNYKSFGLMNSVLGDLRANNDITAFQGNYFMEWNLEMPYRFRLSAGASANQINYTVLDRMATSGNTNHLDGSGTHQFNTVITPRIALEKELGKHQMVFINVAQGYSPPTTSDFVIAYTGEINKNLKPEMATQIELGTRGSVLQNKLSWQVAIFDMNIKDKITAKAVVDDSGVVLYSYGVNAGNQRNLGAEMALSYVIVKDEKKTLSLLRPFANFTYNAFTYSDFKSDANDNTQTRDYTGNTVIGVPPMVFNAGIDAETNFGVYANVNFQYVDDMYVTFDNAHSAPAYTLLNAKVGYHKEFGKHLKVDAFVGGNNLTNSLYYNMVFVNWEKGPKPSIYAPGAYEALFYGGLKLNYTF